MQEQMQRQGNRRGAQSETRDRVPAAQGITWCDFSSEQWWNPLPIPLLFGRVFFHFFPLSEALLNSTSRSQYDSSVLVKKSSGLFHSVQGENSQPTQVTKISSKIVFSKQNSPWVLGPLPSQVAMGAMDLYTHHTTCWHIPVFLWSSLSQVR